VSPPPPTPANGRGSTTRARVAARPLSSCSRWEAGAATSSSPAWCIGVGGGAASSVGVAVAVAVAVAREGSPLGGKGSITGVLAQPTATRASPDEEKMGFSRYMARKGFSLTRENSEATCPHKRMW
jgi:hypothetical protein